MSFQLSFEQLLKYDAGQPGIAIDVSLKLLSDEVTCTAKLDTGSTFCIFTRQVGEKLGLVIEDGLKQMVSTVNGTFAVYPHEVTLLVVGIELDALVGLPRMVSFNVRYWGGAVFLTKPGWG